MSFYVYETQYKTEGVVGMTEKMKISVEKERQVWAKLGRDYREWHPNDKIMYKGGRVETIQGKKANFVNEDIDCGRIIGIYPARSFISFEEDFK